MYETDSTAWKLAKAAHKSLSDDTRDALDLALVETRATAKDIARAYVLAQDGRITNSASTMQILTTRLQIALVEEHVREQERMGGTLNVLTRRIFWLTLALVLFSAVGLAPIVHDVGDWWQARQSAAAWADWANR
jgi:hypothetical protein